MQAVTNSFPCEAHLHRMGLRGSNGCTLCQRARKQREDDKHEGCGRIDPETLGHIQSAHSECSPSESGYFGAPSLLAASSAGDSGGVTRVKGDLPDTGGGAIDANLLEEDVSGTVPTDNSHRDPGE